MTSESSEGFHNTDEGTVAHRDAPTSRAPDDRSQRELIRVAGLKKYFPIETGFFEQFFGDQEYAKAVDGVNLTIHEGETIGIVGESGCGKSTLGRTLTRLYEPTDGSVIFDYEHIETLCELRPIRRRMQYVFQDPLSALNPRKTVGESVAKPLKVHDIADGEAKWKQVAELFEEVGLSQSDINAYPHQLSGGQRQRVGLCRALITEPDLIVFDEPVSALDVTLQAQILNHFRINIISRMHSFHTILMSFDMSVTGLSSCMRVRLLNEDMQMIFLIIHNIHTPGHSYGQSRVFAMMITNANRLQAHHQASLTHRVVVVSTRAVQSLLMGSVLIRILKTTLLTAMIITLLLVIGLNRVIASVRSTHRRHHLRER